MFADCIWIFILISVGEISLSHLMARAARPVLFELKSTNSATPVSSPVQKVRDYDLSQGKKDKVRIVLQPRLCTLRSYGSDPVGVIKSKRDGDNAVSPFFATLSEYVVSSKKTQDFEIISGRLAMVVFAATLALEATTGNSVFKKTDVQGIVEAVGACIGAVASAATFAWFSSARSKVGLIFTLKCNIFIDSLIDHIIDGLFYESELSDWTDDM